MMRKAMENDIFGGIVTGLAVLFIFRLLRII